METASLFIQKVGVVLSGTLSHMTVSDAEKLHVARILIKGKNDINVKFLVVMVLS